MKLQLSTRRTIAASLGAVALVLAASGCSRAGAGTDSDTMQFFFNMGADTPQYKVMAKIVDDFEERTGDKIQVTAQSTNYENDMKVKLAANNVPDLFSTHGWSLLRYSDFLVPLTDQAWAEDVNPALDSAMRDSEGQIFAFPGETDTAGILYNEDVLTEAGIDPKTLTTWDAFDAAAAKVAATGKTAIYSSGKDQGPAGHMGDYLAAQTYSTAEGEQMKDGTFVQAPFEQMLDRVQQWREAGWFNKDYSSASTDDMARALADGTTGFELFQTVLLSQALTLNPEANLGFMPLPTTGDEKPYLVGGEGVDSFGVSKTSTHQDEALAFLDFLAEQDNAAALAEATASAPGLTSVKVDFGTVADSFDTYVTPGTTPVQPYFDRVYLPNGAWDTLIAVTDSVITGQSTVEAASTQMGRQYKTLYGQQ